MVQLKPALGGDQRRIADGSAGAAAQTTNGDQLGDSHQAVEAQAPRGVAGLVASVATGVRGVEEAKRKV